MFTKEEIQSRTINLNKKLHILYNGYGAVGVRVIKLQEEASMEDSANFIQSYIRESVIQDLTQGDSGTSIMKSDIIMFGTYNEIQQQYPELFI